MYEIKQKAVRKNGFDMPLHPTQIFTYVLYALDILSFYLIDLVSLRHNMPLVAGLAVAYLIFASFTFFYAWAATKCNPQDPTIELEKGCKQECIHFDSS